MTNLEDPRPNFRNAVCCATCPNLTGAMYHTPKCNVQGHLPVGVEEIFVCDTHPDIDTHKMAHEHER